MTTPPLSIYSSEIYLHGMSGPRSALPTDLTALDHWPTLDGLGAHTLRKQ